MDTTDIDIKSIKRIYIIAICGKGSGNLAVFLKNEGYDVSGSEYSESTFYPPVSKILVDSGIYVDLSFDPNKITNDVDLVILGGAALIHDINNPQVKKAKEIGIPVISFARAIGMFISKGNHISVVGNHGKTTTTSLLTKMFVESGIDVSYFIGEVSQDFEFAMKNGTSDWSIAEGDEHPSLHQEPGGKFLYHKPKHVLFTSADWDHKNIYKTERSYLDAYLELFRIIPSDGVVVASLDGANVTRVIEESKIRNKIVFYTIGSYKDIIPSNADEFILSKINQLTETRPAFLDFTDEIFYVDDVDYKWKDDLTRFLLKRIDLKDLSITRYGMFETKMIGQIGLENALAALSSAITFGLPVDNIRTALANFKGAKRRMEIVYSGDYIVIDDYAHSPIKIKNSLRSIRTKFFDKKVFVVFQVGQSGLKEKNTFIQLKKVFNWANFVIICKVDPDLDSEEKLYGKDYRDLIRSGAAEVESSEMRFLEPNNVFYAPLEGQVRSIIENNLSRGDVIVIMSSSNNTVIKELVLSLRVSERT